jgi:hypothetical protein
MHNLVIRGEVPAHADLMNHAGLEISRFSPTGASQACIDENCRQDYRDILRARLSVLETKNARLSAPFYRISVFWLMFIFASLGLVAPRHSLSVISIALCAVSVSTESARFVSPIRPANGPKPSVPPLTQD